MKFFLKSIVSIIYLTSLLGCQHIQTVRQPLPFSENQSDLYKKYEKTLSDSVKNTTTPPNERFFILEDWF